MKMSEFRQLLGQFETYGIPITYYSYPERHAPELPYAVYYFPDTRPEAADDKAWSEIPTINIEVYTREKDFLLEHTVDGILDSYGLVYTKTETYINNEHMFQVLYQMEEILWEESDSD